MKKKILTAAAILAAAGTACAFSWVGAASEYQVITGLDNGTETSGYWYEYADDADGGNSSITWPCAKGNDYSTDAMDPIIESCGGLCGNFTLAKGSLDYDPFVGVGFNVAGTETADGGSAEPTDATAWGGLCISYTVDIGNVVLELGLGDAKDAEIKYANPTLSLPKAASANQVCGAWSDFKSPSWATVKTTGDAAGASLASVKFKIQNKDGSTGSFNILSVSSKNDAGGIGIKAAAPVSAVKATLAGRTLSFSGIKTVATAEVMNLQGQVMVKGSVSSATALDLSALDAGVYMVRVAGKTVDFSQKIIVK